MIIIELSMAAMSYSGSSLNKWGILRVRNNKTTKNLFRSYLPANLKARLVSDFCK